jgi:hypothetical protein
MSAHLRKTDVFDSKTTASYVTSLRAAGQRDTSGLRMADIEAFG